MCARWMSRSALVTAALVVWCGVCAGGASAASVSSARVGPARPGRGSELRLSQAPAGLQAAARRALGATDSSQGSPFQQAELTAPDGSAGDNFGYSVAISGSTAVVGAPFKNSNKGTVYVFTHSGSTWSKQAELTASDAFPGADFGFSVAISGSTLVVGAYGKNSGTGAAYVSSSRATPGPSRRS